MKKRPLALFLALGMVVGLLLTACASVAVGNTEGGASGPALLGPLVDTLSLPAFDLAPRAEMNGMRSMGLVRAVEKTLQEQMYSTYGGFGGCDRMDHAPAVDDG
jgi:hypothetical protein